MAETGYTVFYTDAGWMGVLGSAQGVRCVVLPQPTLAHVLKIFGNIEAAAPEDYRFSELGRRIKAYIGGEKVDFSSEQVDYAAATSFQQDVWNAARTIPYGETKSYAWIASLIGKPGAARPVGQALASNPVPIIVPCHRVLRSDGQEGGFAGGIPLKKKLLTMESTREGRH
ncbi:MAG: methylated-DNA--[protein]-cysteine S-methyltransferase [Dehalococcoidia bacterium]|nr:methylated-DNA--[protein]-cysteine S-methyltransferase [Dehalococcoidia bacterium]MDZ4245638.1 methylated-DNA--[protein]-cysteine S-methyltransferase [Dehalococcoidia bacterium]